MCVTLLVLALSPMLANASITPEWSKDYSQALKEATRAGKPIAIVIGSGKDGWKAVGADGLNGEATKLLKDRYVCLYVDRATADGQELAGAFGAGPKPTLVISDKTAKFQAFKEAGPLSDGRLQQVLTQYVAYEVPQAQVQRTSYYSGPQYSTPVFTGGGRGGC